MQRSLFLLAALTATTALTGGCAGLPPARMALPDTLAGVAPDTLQGLGGGRSGSFTLGSGALAGRFERSASRLSLFDSVAADRAAAQYSATSGSGATVEARCSARQTTVTLGIVSAAPRPSTLRCDFSGAIAGTLELAADAATPGATRSGRAQFGAVVLQLQSVHRVQGSPLPLEAPIGYVLTQDGRPVGAVEINGAPRLWRPPAGTPAHDAVTHAALALALLWHPDGG